MYKHKPGVHWNETNKFEKERYAIKMEVIKLQLSHSKQNVHDEFFYPNWAVAGKYGITFFLS